MQAHLECVPCLLNQALGSARTVGLDPEASRRLMKRAVDALAHLRWDVPAPLMGREIFRALQAVTGRPDPYRSQKIIDTEAALALLPEVARAVAAAPDPFLAAVKFSLAGNLIDFGIGGAVPLDVTTTCREALARPVDEDAVHGLERALDRARDVLYLADNAGEIVLDRPLLARIGAERVTVVVRSAPILNDAVWEDAERSGLTSRYNVIASGSDVPGIWLEECDPELRDRFSRADLVLAKGQGNYETLSEQDRPVTYLFMAKCGAVSTELGVPVGTALVGSVRAAS